MREAVIQQEIRLALGQRQDIMMFRINVGKFRPLDGGARVIQSAPEGTPDLLGVITPGRAFAIEVKTEKGKQRLAQAAFRCMLYQCLCYRQLPIPSLIVGF